MVWLFHGIPWIIKVRTFKKLVAQIKLEDLKSFYKSSSLGYKTSRLSSVFHKLHRVISYNKLYKQSINIFISLLKSFQ